MAKTEDLDLDVEQEEPAPKKKLPLKLIIIIAAAVLVLGGGTVGALYFLGVLGGGDEAVAEAAADGAAADEKDGKKGKDGKDGKEKKEAKPNTPPIFMPLDPAFVVNFSEAETTRFLQVNVEVSARDQAVLDALKANMPQIRNNLVMLFSSQKAEQLVSREGKEKLRADALAEVQKVMTDVTGKPGIDNLFFTGFVMQ